MTCVALTLQHMVPTKISHILKLTCRRKPQVSLRMCDFRHWMLTPCSTVWPSTNSASNVQLRTWNKCSKLGPYFHSIIWNPNIINNLFSTHLLLGYYKSYYRYGKLDRRKICRKVCKKVKKFRRVCGRRCRPAKQKLCRLVNKKRICKPYPYCYYKPFCKLLTFPSVSHETFKAI